MWTPNLRLTRSFSSQLPCDLVKLFLQIMLCFKQRAPLLSLNLVALILLAHSEGTEATECECHLATVHLGLAARFAVLATNTVTDTMDSSINGDMGTSTGTTLPFYGSYLEGTPGLNGTLHPNDATAIVGRTAAIAALLDINSRSSTCETALGGVAELGGRTLKPGLYTSTSSMQSECSRTHFTLHAQLWQARWNLTACVNLCDDARHDLTSL
jgi:hypothetical protein